MIRLSSRGDLRKTTGFLSRLRSSDFLKDLDQYGEAGVSALREATPIDTSETANSWRYRVVQDKRGPRIEWYNTNTKTGVSVAILIQYGHGTRGGTFVQGRDFINPAMRPVFDNIANEIWKKVKA